MRFLFVVSGKDVPSTRFRILPFIPFLEEAGHRCDIAYSCPQKYDYFPWLGWRLSQRLKRLVRHWHVVLAERRQYDAILIEREVFDDDTSEFEKRFRDATARLILDVDDGIFLLHPEKFDRISRMCDVAIGGNRWLTEYLKERCAHVEQIPTCVHLAKYPVRPPERQRAQQPRIGWIGTTQNVAFLEVAAEALRNLSSSLSYRLIVVAPSAERLDDVELGRTEVDFRRWTPKTEVTDLLDMDVGIMPLPPGEEWMKYKCGLKLIQYLAVGIPGVASPIGVNQEILAGQRVGRAATSVQDWQDALAELLGNVELRRRLGTAGRGLVEKDFAVEGNWRRFEKTLTG